MTAETNDEEIVTTWHFVIHGEAVPVRVTDVYAKVTAVLAKLRARLIKDGPGIITMDWPSPPARAEIARILYESGWSIEWKSDQREGSWATVLAR